MQNNPINRMSEKKDRGRPTNEQILARGAPEPVETVGPPNEQLPPVAPMICKLCGRGMTPKIIRTAPGNRTIQCGLCGGQMSLIYQPGKPVLVVKL